MKGYTLLLLALIGVTLHSCKSRYKVPETASIHFERTACFGTCPIYSMTIDGEGNGTFEGKRFTEKLGSFSKQLSKEETKELFKTLSEANWESFKTDYKANISDLPSTIFMFKHGKISKEVVVTGEHPEILDVLSSTLIKIAEGEGWESTTLK